MKVKRLMISFLLIISLNGWATSRFYVVKLNGVPVGSSRVVTTVMQNGNWMTETCSELSMKRGGNTIVLKEYSRQEETCNLKPVSFQQEISSSHFKEEFSVIFGLKNGKYTSGKVRGKFDIHHPVQLHKGLTENMVNMIGKGLKVSEFYSFSSALKKIVRNTLQFKGEEVNEFGKFYSFELTEDLDTVKMKTEVLIDSAGEIKMTKVNQMGIVFEYISKEWEKDVAECKGGNERVQAPDLLELTSVKPETYFPASYGVKSIIFDLEFHETMPQGFLDTDFQSETRRVGQHIILHNICPQFSDDLIRGVDEKYLVNSDFIQCDHGEIKKQAAKLRKKSPEDGEFVREVMDFVYSGIHKKNFSVDFSDALSVLRNREGDCTEHSVLAMALLRAEKIPARAALGLVSVNGLFAYHMWVEVLMGDIWYPVDPTFNQIEADPSHIRISSSVLNDFAMAKDFLPAYHFINNVTITPLKVRLSSGKTIEKFNVEFAEGLLYLNVAGICFDPEERVSVISSDTSIPPVSLKLEKDSTVMKISYYDLKFTGYSKHVIASEAMVNSTVSRELIAGKRVVSGERKDELLVFIEFGSVLFKFTFLNTSDTMDMESFKERVYEFCINMLNEGSAE